MLRGVVWLPLSLLGEGLGKRALGYSEQQILSSPFSLLGEGPGMRGRGQTVSTQTLTPTLSQWERALRTFYAFPDFLKPSPPTLSQRRGGNDFPFPLESVVSTPRFQTIFHPALRL